jgi:hypothetical protein
MRPRSIARRRSASASRGLGLAEGADGAREIDRRRGLVERVVGERFFVSECLAGEYVGFEETDDGLWRATYGPIHLGNVNDQGKEPIFVRPGWTKKCHPSSRSEV